MPKFLKEHAVRELEAFADPSTVGGLIRYSSTSYTAAEIGQRVLDSILKYSADAISEQDLRAACNLTFRYDYKSGHPYDFSQRVNLGYDFGSVRKRAYAELLHRWTTHPDWSLPTIVTEPARPKEVGYELFID
jgi:hypothetical protein